MDSTSMEITPPSGKGALGTWRVLDSPGLRARVANPLKMGLGSQANHWREGCVYGPAFKLHLPWEGRESTSHGQNRTREIRPSGIAGGLEET